MPARANRRSCDLVARFPPMDPRHARPLPRAVIARLRSRRAVRRSPALLSASASTCTILGLLALAVAVASAVAIPEAIQNGQKLEESVKGVLQVMDTVNPAEILDCSTTTCWSMVGGASSEPACGASVNSLKLLYRLTPGKTGVTQQSPALRGILHVGLLDVLFAVEPLSYFLFFVDEGKAIGLPTPMRLDAPSRVPFGASTRGLARKIAVEPGSSHAQIERRCLVLSHLQN